MSSLSPAFLSKSPSAGASPSQHANILDLFGIKKVADAHVVAIVAHDDDWAIGGGRTTKVLTDNGVKVSVIVTTDGANGYGKLSEKPNITVVRERETRSAYQALGVNSNDLHFLNFPDLGLASNVGRYTPEGNSGMMEMYVRTLRNLNPKPTHVFIHSNLDPHPDHLMTRDVSLFATGCLAIGDSWQEILGGQWGFRPKIFEYLVYRTPADPQDFQLTHVHFTPEALTTEVGTLLKEGWKSQSIDDLITLFTNRPFDGFREYDWHGCSPDSMLDQFFGGAECRREFLEREGK